MTCQYLISSPALTVRRGADEQIQVLGEKLRFLENLRHKNTNRNDKSRLLSLFILLLSISDVSKLHYVKLL